jgi:hypothetical protein
MVLVYSSMFTPTCTVYDTQNRIFLNMFIGGPSSLHWTKKDEEESWNLPASEINPDDVVGEKLF